MPLPFSALSALLTRLEETPAEKSNQVISKWFSTHRQEIDSLSVSSAVALLSSLLPERRSDRVYAIQSATLCRILGRGLSLCTAQLKDLQAYRLPGRGDIGACLERVLRAGGPPALPVVTVDEVDQVLNKLAAQCRFSGDKVRQGVAIGKSHGAPQRLSLEEKDRMIGNVFKRLSPGCAKWLTRLILKDLSSAVIDDNFVLIEFHFLLPDILRFQNDFSVAVSLLKSAKLRAYPSHADAQSRALHHQTAAMMLEPRVGCKVGLPTFVKARGMDSCLKIVGERSWVLERKYDGEYCEVHVDLSASASLEGCITIFSKSGKESTQDRRGLLPSLIASLRLGQEWCKIRDRAIMLGEIFVWSTLGGVLGEGGIMPFDKIRKHVSRSGTIVGTEMDSPVHEHEQLAIVFFDLLLLDDEVVMARSVEERRAMLRKVYAKIHGRVMGAEWKIVDFAAPTARSTLERHFAASIAQRCEGLVLKPCGEPYFPLVGETARPFIKVKKDYIDGLGDEADFAVIGGSYNPQLVRKEYGKVHWTDFHLGCLLNPDEVRRFQKRPSYRLVGTLSAGPCVPKAIVKSLNALGQGAVDNQPPYVFDIEGSKTLGTRFKKPFVLEVLGSGFVNPPNSGGSYMLRHPRARRLHHDRHWTTCVSFQELQTQAQVALDRKDDDADEAKAWLRRLKGKFTRLQERESQRKRVLSQETPPKSDKRVCVEEEARRVDIFNKNTASAVVKSSILPSFTSPTTCSRTCLFADATVFLAPCIATTPYILDDLLGAHEYRLAVHTHPELLFEEQGRKVILVESKRRQVVERLLDSCGRMMRSRDVDEGIGGGDWRVLELSHCVLFDEGGKDKGNYFVNWLGRDDLMMDETCL